MFFIQLNYVHRALCFRYIVNRFPDCLTKKLHPIMPLFDSNIISMAQQDYVFIKRNVTSTI